MEKRLPLALLLSALVLITWTMFVNPPRPAPEGPTPTAGPLVESGEQVAARAAERRAAAEAMPVVGSLVREEAERELTLAVGTPGEPGSYRATFTNRGARLLELSLADYVDRAELAGDEIADPAHWVTLVHRGGGALALRGSQSSEGLLRPDEDLDEALWTMSEAAPGGERGVDFRYAPGTGVVFEKRVRFVPGRHVIEVELAIVNEAAPAAAGAKQFEFTPVDVLPRAQDDKFYVEPVAVIGAFDDGEVEVKAQPAIAGGGGKSGGVLSAPGGIDFAGVHNKYFAVLMREAGAGPDGAPQPAQTIVGATWRRALDEPWIEQHPTRAAEGSRLLVTDVQLRLNVPRVGERSANRYRIWAGPKKAELITAESASYDALLQKDLGFFAGISNVLLAILRFFHGIFGNWGVAIILLTVTVRTVLFPLNRRSQTAMARYQSKMKRLQPKIDELKKRYEKDPQKLRQEQAQLMQKEGAFPPLGGCMPMFLQIPVFFGLFQALRVAFDLRQAPFFGWIRDLSLPDRLMATGLSTELPLVGSIAFINVLPPLMVVLWIWQQRTMPTPTDEQAARMQKMMMWMPVVFGVMLYNYAAGLSLYMITQSTLGIFEQRVIKKYWPVDDTEQVKKKTGFLARMAELQAQKVKELEAAQRDRARAKARR